MVLKQILIGTDQVLSLDVRHFLDYGPEPALKAHEPLTILARFIVEAGVRNKSGDVDVTNPVKQQTEVLCRQVVQRAGRQHVKHSCAQLLKIFRDLIFDSLSDQVNAPRGPCLARAASGTQRIAARSRTRWLRSLPRLDHWESGQPNHCLPPGTNQCYGENLRINIFRTEKN